MLELTALAIPAVTLSFLIEAKPRFIICRQEFLAEFMLSVCKQTVVAEFTVASRPVYAQFRFVRAKSLVSSAFFRC